MRNGPRIVLAKLDLVTVLPAGPGLGPQQSGQHPESQNQRSVLDCSGENHLGVFRQEIARVGVTPGSRRFYTVCQRCPSTALRRATE